LKIGNGKLKITKAASESFRLRSALTSGIASAGCIPPVPAFSQEPGQSPIRNPQSAIRNSHGFTYIALIAALVIIGISLGAAGKYWQNVMLRDREEELLFRGDQYRQAIELYYRAVPGKLQYPPNIEKLLKDDRTPAGKRHLRQQYKDPITGEDFEIITSQTVTVGTGGVLLTAQQKATPGIIGVRSKSEKEPLKKDNFPVLDQDFAGASSYSEWKFIASTIKSGQTITLPGPLIRIRQ
jgi:type II secretory pathway pseudopilin PulG